MIEPANTDRLSTTIATLHHASQFVALVGKAFLPPKEDDSHTTFFWDIGRQVQVGQWIPHNKRWRLGLHIKDFKLFMEGDDGTLLEERPLHLEEKSNLESWLQMALLDVGADPTHWVWDLHYDLPDYPFDSGIPYRKPGNNLLRTYAAMRDLTEIVLHELNISPVRIWPHHFDSGALIEEDSVTIGAGLAMPDGLSDLPYWYATRYPTPDKWAHIEAPGEWWSENLQGRALAIDQVWALPAPQQKQQLREFFSQTLAYYQK